jgi:hypothetical protein
MLPQGYIELHRGRNIAVADVWLVHKSAISEVVELKTTGGKRVVQVNGHDVAEDYDAVKRLLAGEQPKQTADAAGRSWIDEIEDGR